ncbi:MAG: PQQ-binding-like beta-propeller repeat protein [Acidimicrobiia bacterium]|nr:PQQ-binding-like beta-propeller repeat protein [Acidimicrobiia bacterium]
MPRRPLFFLLFVMLAATSCSTAEPRTAAEPIAPAIDPLPELAPTSPTQPLPTDVETQTTTTTTTTTTLPPGLVPATTVGEPWGSVPGLTMFRGNPTRTFYGTGPAPDSLEVLWRFPERAMCGTSSLGGEATVWCGTGWTGQPVVWERPDGITEVIFGAYDKRIHFLDAMTGERTRPDFNMGDIVKGSVVLDPDGYPILYAGSRDSRYRVIALDREVPTEIWGLEASSVAGMWNNDWDSSAAIVDDLLLIGGENSWWFAVKLNRDWDETGLVTVQPEIVYATPMWTDELLQAVGRQQSVESSTAVFEDTAFVANSAGRVVGFDIADGDWDEDRVIFDFWMGDDVDSSIVIDGDGMLYVSSEVDLSTSRGAEIGQLAKLDPTRADDPLLWSVAVPSENGVDGGIWATPALADDVLFVPTNTGNLLAVDTTNGEVVWQDDVGYHAWSSPVVIEDSLIVAIDCEVNSGFRSYDISEPGRPTVQWESRVTGGCIESTPAVWEGRLYVGSRDGYFYALGAN